VGRANCKFERAIESGQLDELLQLSSAEAKQRGVLHLAILANSLFGELQAALWHHRWAVEKKVKFSESEQATVNFALGVGHTRISEYGKARGYFARNFRYRRSNARARFYFYQGLGFYRYFTGAFLRSTKFARAALEQAVQSRFEYGQLISEELLAHGLTESGDVRLGLKHLKHSLDRARVLDHKSLRQSFRLLLLLNEARYGLNWDCIPRLEKALLKLHPKDTYSRNAVKLELANQWVLRGQASVAFQVLDESCDSIYASQNRRQIAQLNFRLAFLTWLRGRRDEALHLLKSAELHLHKEVDAAQWKRMRGLRERILNSSEKTIHTHAKKTKSFGEDRIGDLYELVAQKDQRALRLVLDHGLHFFLYAFYQLKFDQKALLFDLLPRGVMVVDHGNITVVDKGFSRVNRRVLEALAASHQSKEELIERIWGYNYDASRHDALIYTSISKIRQLLGSAGNWIEVDEKGYRLQSGVTLKTNEAHVADKGEKTALSMTRLNSNSALNFRQLRILSRFDTHKVDWLDITDVMRDFEVSRATATRDLGELTAMGLLRRLGKARATKYARGQT
jgi:DNA-binding winged helix-turn-helix (wHTH) protein